MRLRFAGRKGKGSMTLYVYEPGSPFESVMNLYMIYAKPIRPPVLEPPLNHTIPGVANESMDGLDAAAYLGKIPAH